MRDAYPTNKEKDRLMADIEYKALTAAQSKQMDKAWNTAEQNERDSFRRLITDTAAVKRAYAAILWTFYKVMIGDNNADFMSVEFSAICKAFGFQQGAGNSYRGRSAMALQEDYVCLRGETDMQVALANYKADPKNNGEDCKSLQKLVPYLTKEINKRKPNYKPRESGAAQSPNVIAKAQLRIAAGNFGKYAAYQDKPGNRPTWKATDSQRAKIDNILSQCGLDIDKFRAMDIADMRLIAVIVDEAIAYVKDNGSVAIPERNSNAKELAKKVTAKKAAKSS